MIQPEYQPSDWQDPGTPVGVIGWYLFAVILMMAVVYVMILGWDWFVSWRDEED